MGPRPSRPVPTGAAASEPAPEPESSTPAQGSDRQAPGSPPAKHHNSQPAKLLSNQRQGALLKQPPTHRHSYVQDPHAHVKPVNTAQSAAPDASLGMPGVASTAPRRKEPPLQDPLGNTSPAKKAPPLLPGDKTCPVPLPKTAEIEAEPQPVPKSNTSRAHWADVDMEQDAAWVTFQGFPPSSSTNAPSVTSPLVQEGLTNANEIPPPERPTLQAPAAKAAGAGPKPEGPEACSAKGISRASEVGSAKPKPSESQQVQSVSPVTEAAAPSPVGGTSEDAGHSLAVPTLDSEADVKPHHQSGSKSRASGSANSASSAPFNIPPGSCASCPMQGDAPVDADAEAVEDAAVAALIRNEWPLAHDTSSVTFVERLALLQQMCTEAREDPEFQIWSYHALIKNEVLLCESLEEKHASQATETPQKESTAMQDDDIKPAEDSNLHQLHSFVQCYFGHLASDLNLQKPTELCSSQRSRGDSQQAPGFSFFLSPDSGSKP